MTHYLSSPWSQELFSPAIAGEKAVVGLGGLGISIGGFGVVVAVVAALLDGQLPIRDDQPRAVSGGLAKRERELDVAVAIEARLRVRAAGRESRRTTKGEEVAEDRVDVAGACIDERPPLVVEVDIDPAPPGRDDVRVAVDRVEHRRQRIAREQRRQITPDMNARDVCTQQSEPRRGPVRQGGRDVQLLDSRAGELVQ